MGGGAVLQSEQDVACTMYSGRDAYGALRKASMANMCIAENFFSQVKYNIYSTVLQYWRFLNFPIVRGMAPSTGSSKGAPVPAMYRFLSVDDRHDQSCN